MKLMYEKNNNLSNIREYVSHFSAAKLWNVPNLNIFLKGEYKNECPLCGLTDSTVTGPNLRYKKHNHIVHVHNSPLPRGAVVKRDNYLVSSPEMLFLDVARTLDIHQLILFGIQLCSYSPKSPTKALTTKRKLKEFLNKSQGLNGHKKAERAVKYVENGSNSVMESIAFMMLTLPYKLGGFGLDGACFNYEVLLNADAQKQLGQKRCYIDIFYPEANLGIEYDSSKFHGDGNKYDDDMLRSNTLKSQGIDILHLTKSQIYQKKACEQFAHTVSVQLNKRLRFQTDDYYKYNSKLRKLLY